MKFTINTAYMIIILKGALLAVFLPTLILWVLYFGAMAIFINPAVVTDKELLDGVLYNLLYNAYPISLLLSSVICFFLIVFPVFIVIEYFKKRSENLYFTLCLLGGVLLSVFIDTIGKGYPTVDTTVDVLFYSIFVSLIFWNFGVKKLP